MRIRHYFTSPPAAGLGCELQEEEEEEGEVEGEKSASRGRQSRENSRETRENSRETRASQTSPKKPVRSLGRRPAGQAGSEQGGMELDLKLKLRLSQILKKLLMSMDLTTTQL